MSIKAKKVTIVNDVRGIGNLNVGELSKSLMQNRMFYSFTLDLYKKKKKKTDHEKGIFYKLRNYIIICKFQKNNWKDTQ